MHTTGQLKSTNAVIQAATRSILFVGMAVLLGSGCASTRSKFKSHEKVDLMPFAAQTIAMLSTTEYPLSQDNSVLIREFLGPDTPGMAELDAALAETDRVTESMQIYSVELVTISRMGGSEADRIIALGAVVRTLEAPIRKKVEVTDEAFEAMLADIASKPDFLAGVRAIQPLIESAGLYYGSLLDDAERMATVASGSVDAAIDAKFTPMLDFKKVLDARKGAILKGLTLVHRYRSGERDALVTLREGEFILDPTVLPSPQGTRKELALAEAHLLERLTVMQTLHSSIEPEIDLYRRSHRELDEQYQFVRDGVAAARLKFIVWSQAHEKMASGMKDPAEWFDIKDAPSLLIKAGVKAVK